MTATRAILILILIITLAFGAFGQENTSTTATETAATTSEETTTQPAVAVEDAMVGSYEVRNRLSRLLNEYPVEVGRILALDASLLQNEEFLAGYPAIAKFVKQYPEVQRNPGFYLAEWRPVERRNSILGDFMEGLAIFSIFVFVALALAWFVRTIIEQKRWSRLSKTQTEVHNKILDRFGSTEELLAYMKSEAGTKFLESAPIPLRAEEPAPNAPLARVLWSIQIGVVVAAGALGLLFVSGRFEKEAAQEMFALGMIGFSVGAGFILSAFISLFLSRRLGLWKNPNDDASVADSGLVR